MKSLNILITRPKHQAQEISNLIRAGGDVAILFPTIEIADPHDLNSLKQGLAQLTNFDIAIFTSANAVLKIIPYWPHLANYPKIAAIGPATALALKKLHLQTDYLPAEPFNSEALLNLPIFQQLKNQRLILFTGEDGRPLLANSLKQRGANVFIAYAYRRILPKAELALRPENIDLIICHSGESLKNLAILIKNNQLQMLLKLPLIVISQAMAILAKQLGFEKPAILAENATDKAIMVAINQIKRTSQ